MRALCRSVFTHAASERIVPKTSFILTVAAKFTLEYKVHTWFLCADQRQHREQEQEDEERMEESHVDATSFAK